MIRSVVIDAEWIILIQEARDLGLTVEEIKQFIEEKGEQV